MTAVLRATAMIGLWWVIGSAHAQPACVQEKIGNTLDSADDLKVLSGPVYRFNQCVDVTNDREDYYRFTISQPTALNIGVGGRGGTFVVEVLDVNGLRLGQEQGAEGHPANLGGLVTAGTFHVRVAALAGTSFYEAEFNPSIETAKINVRAGRSIGWNSIISLLKPLARMDIQIFAPANAGGYWIVAGARRNVDVNPWSVNDAEYRGLRYVAGSAGSVETVYFRMTFQSGEQYKWQAARITSVP